MATTADQAGARDVVLDMSRAGKRVRTALDQRLVNFGCLTSIVGSVTIELKISSVGACAASTSHFKIALSTCSAARASTAPPAKRRLVPSTPRPDGSTPSEAVVQPVGGARATCCQKRVHGAHARRKRLEHARRTIVGQRGHHRDVRNGLGAAEMPRRVEHTRRVARPTFRPLCAAVNARTNAGSAAAPAHDPMRPRDARRRQGLTYSRNTGPLFHDEALRCYRTGL